MNKKLSSVIMDGVYMQVNDLPTDENSRYDIKVDEQNNYSLVFWNSMSDEEPTTVIKYCEGFEFVEQLKRLRK